MLKHGLSDHQLVGTEDVVQVDSVRGHDLGLFDVADGLQDSPGDWLMEQNEHVVLLVDPPTVQWTEGLR